MTTETMTIHKALCELKTLNARIVRRISEGSFCYSNKHSNAKINGEPIAKVCEDISARFQSCNDLIARRNAIKRAVILSNATTKVVIDGVEYTVAEAIDMKDAGLSGYQALINEMTNDLQAAQRDCTRSNGEVLDSRADDYIKSMFGTFDAKNMSEEIRKVREAFVAAQTVELVDPLDIKARIEELRARCDRFLVDVDAALSVSNALTTIEITY